MANCNAITIRNSKNTAAPSASNLAHNSALTKANYWLNDGANIVQNFRPKSHQDLNEIWNNWIADAKQRYLDNPNNKRALKSNAVKIEEGLIVIGSDVDATPKQIKQLTLNFIKKFEDDNNTKVLHWAIHDHEGHKDKDGNEKVNRHIHFLFDNVDADGTMVRRNWKRSYLKQLQDDIFDASKSVISNIERATNYEELGQKAPKQKHHRVFRKEQEQAEKIKELTEQVSELQNELDSEKKQNKLQKEIINKLKQDYTNARTELKETKQASQEDYKALKSKHTELLSNVSHPTMTYENTDTKVLYKDLSKHYKDLYEDSSKKLSEALETIKSKNEQISTLKQEKTVLEQSMNDLELKNKRLEDEISLLKNKNNANLGFNQAIKNLLNQKIQELDEIKILLEDDDILNLHYMIDEIKSETQNIINTKQQSKAIKENYQEQEYSNPYEELENLVKKQRQ
jgi:DNA repair exonuclease SbcCD ATPase subunit